MEETVDNEVNTSQRSALLTGAVLIGLLFASSWLPRAAQSDTIQVSLWIMAAMSAVFLFLLRNTPIKIERSVRKHHVVQFLMHGTIFAYWATVVDAVADQFVLIGIQIVLAYALDFFLSWWKRERWVCGFGPLPVIGSINLFLWFKDEWWYLQLLMVVLAFASKPLLRWTREDRSVHIFNPSAIALAAMSLGVLLAGKTDIPWGQTIATSLNAPTYMFEVIFAVGIAVQVLFDTTLVTAGAALSVWVLGIIYYQVTGWWFFNDTHIPIAVFLGMNLLITDPTTSPKNKIGRLLFGATYGLAVFPLWSGLQAFGRPTFYDKLLQVPLLNLLVPSFERLGNWLTERLPQISWAGDNRVHVGIWLTVFLCLRPGLIDHPGKAVSHGHMFARGVGGVEKDTRKAAALFRKSCYRGVPLGCFELAVLHLAGDGVPQDPAKAATLLNTACDGGEFGACTELGLLTYEGRGVERSPTQAATLYDRACKGDEANGCANLGLMYRDGDGVPSNPERATSLFKRACTLEHEGACALIKSPNLGDPKADPVAACEAGDAAACGALAVREEQRGTNQPKRVVDLLTRACEGGHLSSCNTLGGKYAMGLGVTKNIPKAAALAQTACDGGIPDACGNLAGMYLEGQGVPRDLNRARTLLSKACSGGVTRACQFLKRLSP